MTIAQKIILSLIVFFIPEIIYLEANILGYHLIDFFFWFFRIASLFAIALILSYDE